MLIFAHMQSQPQMLFHLFVICGYFILYSVWPLLQISGRTQRFSPLAASFVKPMNRSYLEKWLGINPGHQVTQYQVAIFLLKLTDRLVLFLMGLEQLAVG